MRGRCRFLSAGLLTALLAACENRLPNPYPETGVAPVITFPVTDNETPYSRCLASLADPSLRNRPTFAIGDVSDKTGQVNYDEDGHALSQGVSEMVMSAFAKTGVVNLVERFDLRISLGELQLTQNRLVDRQMSDFQLRPYDFLVLGALTELNYNIISEGVGLRIAGIGGGARTVVINVALDLRVVVPTTLQVAYITSLQKQVLGIEVAGDVFRFFGNTFVEFDAGRIQNEPLQLGVRSVVEMAVYQTMTEFLGLPVEPGCSLERPGHITSY